MACGSDLPAATPILSGRDTPTSPYRLGLKMTNQNRERPLRASLKMVLAFFSRNIFNFFSRLPRSWKLLFSFTEKLETSFLIYREVGDFFSHLPGSWKLLFSFTGKLIVIKKVCISTLADLLNCVINKILVNVIKKIFVCPGKTSTRNTNIDISLFTQLPPSN